MFPKSKLEEIDKEDKTGMRAMLLKINKKSFWGYLFSTRMSKKSIQFFKNLARYAS